jgi:hypothetical protein
LNSATVGNGWYGIQSIIQRTGERDAASEPVFVIVENQVPRVGH